MKKFNILISIIVFAFCMFSLSSCKYKYLIQACNERNEVLPDNLTSSISLAEYARNIVVEDFGKEFEIGSVDMRLDSGLKGEVEVTLVESSKKRPLITSVSFDTKNNMLLCIDSCGRENKANPGIINLQNWKIDYAEAIEISKEFYSETDGFRYDDVIIRTINSFPATDESWEDWSVTFRDFQSKRNYNTRIEPYTGEILNHGIWKWGDFS